MSRSAAQFFLQYLARLVSQAGGESYGGRPCPKLVRCYFKREINRYRVELELHSAILRKQRVDNIADLARIAGVLYPAHIAFKIMKWKKLESHLRRRYGKVKAAELIDRARTSKRLPVALNLSRENWQPDYTNALANTVVRWKRA